jgi:site-specific DNA-cytosine methylase
MQKTIGGIEIFSASHDNRIYSIDVFGDVVTPRQSMPFGNWGITTDGKILTGNVHWEKTKGEYRLSEIIQPLPEIDKQYYMPTRMIYQIIVIDWLKKNRKQFKDEKSFVASLKMVSRQRPRNRKDLATIISAVKRKYLKNIPTIQPPFECRKCSGHIHAVNIGNMGLFGGRNIYEADEPTMTLVTGKSLGFIQEGKWRYATEIERERLMGTPDQWTMNDGNPRSQRIKQTGNAIVVPIVQFMWERILNNLNDYDIRYVGSCDIDHYAKSVYEKNFRQQLSHRDIREVTIKNELKEVYEAFAGIGGFRLALNRATKDKEIRFCENVGEIPPDPRLRFDIFCGGFPCQTFSSAGKRLGFMDKVKGTLFFEVARITKEFKPMVVFLENVEGLLHNDHGRTFRTVICTLAEIGYEVEWQLINSRYLIPQDRERVFIVAHRSDLSWRHIFPVTQAELEEYRIKLDSGNKGGLASPMNLKSS